MDNSGKGAEKLKEAHISHITFSRTYYVVGIIRGK